MLTWLFGKKMHELLFASRHSSQLLISWIWGVLAQKLSLTLTKLSNFGRLVLVVARWQFGLIFSSCGSVFAPKHLKFGKSIADYILCLLAKKSLCKFFFQKVLLLGVYCIQLSEPFLKVCIYNCWNEMKTFGPRYFEKRWLGTFPNTNNIAITKDLMIFLLKEKLVSAY